MTNVPVQVLKQQLAAWLARAQRGERIVVTRRNRAIAELGPVRPAGRVIGSRVGTGALEPSGIRLAPGVLAAALADDRSDER